METVDVLGVGFGPSNISIAIALAESYPDLSALFVESKPSFAWHEGLMFPDAEMQVSFLKDLISQVNPRSHYTFLNYLNAQGRLHEFVNLRTFYPTRVEFNDYYSWVAKHFDDRVSYSSTVEAVSEFGTDALLVSIRDEVTGELREIATRCLVVADGGKPHVPGDTETGAHLFHASEARERLTGSFPDRDADHSFNIVGGGQTTADLFIYLSTHYPNAAITTSMRSFAIRPEDDTHFVNELFFPEMPDWFYGASQGVKQKVLNDFASAAHSGASYDLIPKIYRTRYEARVAGSDRYKFERLVEYVGGRSLPVGAQSTFRSLETGLVTTRNYDAVILATGYRYPTPLPLLSNLSVEFETTQSGSYEFNRDYSIKTVGDTGPRVYLQGYAEASHGFSEVLLSLMPQRAAEIARSASRAALREPSMPLT